MPRKDMIQARRGTAAEWAASTDILYSGELAWATDTNVFKLGDGFNTWSGLPGVAPTEEELSATFVGRGSQVNSNVSALDPYLEIIADAGAASAHFQVGPNFSGPYVLGFGKDYPGQMMEEPNKANGVFRVATQRVTVTDPASYHSQFIQQSLNAPLVRMETSTTGAADVLQLLAFGTPTAGQTLLYVGDPAGEAGKVYAATGILRWQRSVRILGRQVASVETPSYLELAQSSGQSETTAKKSYHGAEFDIYFGNAGAAGGSYYPYRFNHGTSFFTWQTAATITNKGTNPVPDDVSTWTTQVSVSHSAGVSIAAGMLRANTNVLGFYGATASAQPAAVANATDAATVITQLNALLARLRTIGLLAP